VILLGATGPARALNGATFDPLEVNPIGGQPAPVPLPPAGLLVLFGAATLALAGAGGGTRVADRRQAGEPGTLAARLSA